MRFCVKHAQERAGLPVEIIPIDPVPLTAVGKISKPALKLDILRRVVDAIVRTRADGCRCTTTIDGSGKRPKVEIRFYGAAPDAETLTRLREDLAGFAFESEVCADTK